MPDLKIANQLKKKQKTNSEGFRIATPKDYAELWKNEQNRQLQNMAKAWYWNLDD